MIFLSAIAVHIDDITGSIQPKMRDLNTNICISFCSGSMLPDHLDLALSVMKLSVNT